MLTVHDLFPIYAASNARSAAATAYYRMLFPIAVRRADHVVAVSEFTAGELVSRLGVPSRKITVIGHGLDHRRFRPAGPEHVDRFLSRSGLARGYVVYVGSLKQHKNLATLVRSLEGTGTPLVIAGPPRRQVETLFGGASTAVIGIGRVDDADLPALYEGAIAHALPSRYEGCGLTVWEAMACGTPVLASTGGALPETVGEAGMLIDPDDVGGWRDAIVTLTNDESARTDLIARGRARISELSWLDAARSYTAVYRDVR